MAKKNKVLKSAQKAYNKNQQTKGGKAKAKKDGKKPKKTVTSSYDNVRDKTQVNKTNIKNASIKKAGSSIKKNLQNNVAETQKKVNSGAVKPTNSHWGNVSSKAQTTKIDTKSKGTIGRTFNDTFQPRKGETVQSATANITRKKGETYGEYMKRKFEASKEFNANGTKRETTRTKTGFTDEDQKKVKENAEEKLLNAYGKKYNRVKAFRDQWYGRNGYEGESLSDQFYAIYGREATDEERRAYYKDYWKPDYEESTTKLAKKQAKDIAKEEAPKVQVAKELSRNEAVATGIYSKFVGKGKNGDTLANTAIRGLGTLKYTTSDLGKTKPDGTKVTKSDLGKTKTNKKGDPIYQQTAVLDDNGNKVKYTESDIGTKKADGSRVKASDVGKVKTQNRDIAEELGSITASGANKGKFATGFMQGSGYADIFNSGVGTYNKASQKVLQNVKDSDEFNGGYMAGIMAQFMAGGTNTIAEGLVKGIGKNGIERSAVNMALRKGGLDLAMETPQNVLDAYKMATNPDGSFNKKAFASYMALNSGMSFGMGGAIGGIGNKIVKNDVKDYINIASKINEGVKVSSEELGRFEKINKKFAQINQGTDISKKNLIDSAKAQTVLSKADGREYMRLLMKKELTQQEKAKLSSYESIIKQNYSELEERTGDKIKLYKAQKQLDEAIKMSKDKAESMVKTAEVLSKNTNIKFEVASPEAIAKAVGNNASADDIVKGVYLEQPDGTVKVMLNEQSPQAHQVVAGHESGHIIKSASSEDFDALGVMLSKYAKERGEYEDLVAEMSRAYVGESDEAFQEEVICEMIGRYIFGEDDTFIKQLAGEKPSILQQIADYIKGLLGKTTNKELREEYTRILDSMPEKFRADDKTKFSKVDVDSISAEDDIFKSARRTLRDTPEARDVKFDKNNIVDKTGEVTKDADAGYMYAVENGDEATAQKYIDALAEKRGYEYDAYHGSDEFGFTKFDENKLDDGMSIFASSDSGVAGSYTKNPKVKAISQKPRLDVERLDKLESIARENGLDNIQSEIDFLNRSAPEEYETFYDVIDTALDKHRDNKGQVVDSNGNVIDDSVIDEIYALADEIEFSSKDKGGIYHAKLKISNPLVIDAKQSNWSFIDSAEVKASTDERKLVKKYDDFTSEYFNTYRKNGGKLDAEEFINSGESQIFKTFDELKEAGLVAEKFNAGSTMTTREVADYAKQNGHDGVVIKNVYDTGKYGGASQTSTVYIVFDSSQFKSADAITKNSNGDVIPLSKRFDDTNKNIKFSKSSKEAKAFEDSIAERMAKGESTDTLFDDAYKFIKDKTPKSYEEDVVGIKELRDARRLMRTTDIRITTTDATKGLSINRLLENVGYDKKTIGSKINLKKNSGISVERAYRRLQEVDSTRFPDLDTEEDMLRKMCDVAMEDTRAKQTIEIPDKDYDEMIKQEAKEMLERAFVKNQSFEKAEKGMSDAKPVSKKAQEESIQTSTEGEKADILRDAKVSNKPVADLSTEALNKEYNSLGFGIKNGKTEEHIKLRKDRQAEIRAELEKRGEFTPSKNEEVETLINEKGYGWEKAKEYNDKLTELREKEKKLKENGNKEELDSVKNEIKDTTKKLYDTVDQSKSTFDEGKDILEQAKERGGGNTVKVNKATWKDLVEEEGTTRPRDFGTTIRRLFEASLIDFETTGKKLMRSTNAEDRILGRQLLDQTNSVYTARNRSAYMVEGKNGLNDAFTVEYKGKKVDLLTNDEMREDLSNYLFYKHAIGNRHELNKDVFGQRYTQKDLVDLMGALEDKYGKDVLESFETNIRGYIDKLNKYRLDAGLVTKEQLEKLEDIYPYYVPTNRVGLEKVSNYEMPTGSANIDSGIKTATGSDKPLEELYLQLVKMTDRTVKSSEQNRMMNLYAKAKGFDVEALKKAKPEDIETTSIGAQETTKGKWRVTFMRDGEKVTIPVNKHCAKGLREWNGQDFSTLLNVLGKFSRIGRPYKALITDWNLIFGVRNGMRDQQQAIVNSSDSYWYSKSIPRTFASVNPKRSLKDSPFRQLYEANGGKWSSIAQYNSLEDLTSLNKNGLKKANEKTLGKVINQIENINGAIELTPRLTEFIGTLQKEADGILKKEGSSVSKLFDEIEASAKREGLSGSKLTEEIETRYANAIIDKLKSAGNFDDVVRTAMRNSADITLNFSRSGVITKALNSGLFPYLNPSVQGLSKTMRLFTEGHTNGTLINFLMKLGVCTVAPSVVNELLLAGNEEYQSLNTRDKDMNFFIPCGDGQFIKIPKPRENAVLSEPFTYATRWLLDSAQYGTMEEMKQMFVSAKDNIGVIDAGDFIFAPLIKNFMQNQNWYGGKILNNQELRNEESNEAYKNYDESTSWVAKKLGKLINMSPKRIDNVMDSYMGLIYDLGISQTSEKAKNDLSWKYNPATVQFMKDSVFSNKYTTQFWDKADKLNEGAKGDNDTRAYTEFMAKYGKDTFTYDNAISDIDTDKSIPKSVKADMKRELRKYKNALVKRGLEGKDVIYDPMQRIINVYEKYGVKNATDKALSTFAYGDHKDAYEYMKSTKEYRDASPKEKKELQQKFLNTYKGIKRIARNTGDSDDFINYSTVTYVCAKKGYTKGYIANCYCLKSKEYSVEKMINRAQKYIDAGYTTKNFEVTMRALNRGCDKLGDDDKRFASQLDDYDKAMILAEKGYRDGAYYIASQYLDSRMNAGRCLTEGHSNGKFKWTDKRVNDFCNEYNIVHDKNYKWDNEYVVKCIKDKYSGKSMEEKAGLYQVITGDTENFPFGEIGDYSHKNDTGLEDGKKSGGRGGRRGRRGHGGGGSGGGKGTVPKTESGAINGKVTNPFSSNTSSKSNLNDAYRKKLKKLREQTR